MPGPYPRVAHGDRANDGSATDAADLFNAHSEGLEALEAIEERATRQTPGNRVAFIGDSLMVYGPSEWTVTDQITCWPLWASLMTNQRCRVVKNAGVSGEQASQGLSRFSTDITPYAPTAVVIGFGTNEIAVGTSFSTWKTNMIALVAAVKAISATPILMLIPPNDYSAPFQASISKFNAWIKTYADANGIAVIDVYKPSVDVSDGSFTSSLTYDGGHANEAGHVAWATAAKTVFESILPPNYPLLAQDNYEPSNLLANGCFYLDSNADGTPDSWTWSGTGSPSLVTDSAAQGKWFRFGGSGARSLSQSETVNGTTITVGDTIAVSGKVRAASMGGTQTYTVTVTFTGGSTGSIKPISGLTQNLTDGTFYQEYVVPSGTTSITVALSTATGTGVVDFAQVGLFNLTTLAA
jgi:lysophospholipase L1-like esterase